MYSWFTNSLDVRTSTVPSIRRTTRMTNKSSAYFESFICLTRSPTRILNFPSKIASLMGYTSASSWGATSSLPSLIPMINSNKSAVNLNVRPWNVMIPASVSKLCIKYPQHSTPDHWRLHIKKYSESTPSDHGFLSFGQCGQWFWHFFFWKHRDSTSQKTLGCVPVWSACLDGLLEEELDSFPYLDFSNGGNCLYIFPISFCSYFTVQTSFKKILTSHSVWYINMIKIFTCNFESLEIFASKKFYSYCCKV